MTRVRRLLAVWLVACAAAPDGQVSLRAPLDEVRQLPAGDAKGVACAPSPVRGPLPDSGPEPVRDSVRDPGALRSVPWQTGPQVGHGVAFKDTKNSAGENVFMGYAGYRIDLASAEAWVEALYDASLAARGVRYLWAVQGPNDRTYSNSEIGNSKIVMTMLPLVGPRTRFILIAGHSSGSFVAHELLAQLAGGKDPDGVTTGRVVYFNLDGGASGLTTQSVGRLRHAYFVAARDGKSGTDSPRLSTMRALGTTYAAAGGYWQSDADESGCPAGAQWCVHDSLVTTTPHAPTNASAQLDYSEFSGRQPCHSWIDAKGNEAGLQP